MKLCRDYCRETKTHWLLISSSLIIEDIQLLSVLVIIELKLLILFLRVFYISRVSNGFEHAPTFLFERKECM